MMQSLKGCTHKYYVRMDGGLRVQCLVQIRDCSEEEVCQKYFLKWSRLKQYIHRSLTRYLVQDAIPCAFDRAMPCAGTLEQSC